MYLNAKIHNPILLYLQAMEDLEIPLLIVFNSQCTPRYTYGVYKIY